MDFDSIQARYCPTYPEYCFEKPKFGAYMLHHMASNKVLVACGELGFSRHYDQFMLVLGIHPCNELQDKYNSDPRIAFTVLRFTESLEQAASDARQLISSLHDSGALFNEEKDFQYKKPVFENDFVNSLSIFSLKENEVYDKIGVYTLINRNSGYFYIGSGDVRNRSATHRRYLKKNKHRNYKFQKAYQEDASFELFWVPMETRKEAFALEQNLIDRFWSNPNLLNISKDVFNAAGFLGKQHTDETVGKISDSVKKYWQQLPDTVKEQRALKISERHASMSDSEKAKLSEKLRLKMIEWYKNPDARKITSESVKNSFTPERKQVISRAMSVHRSKPNIKEFYSKKISSLWKTDAYREKVTTALKKASNTDEAKSRFSRISKAYNSQSVVKKAFSLRIKERLQNDQEYREKQLARIKIHNVDRSKAVSIKGVVYSSIREAQRLTKISRDTIKKRILENHPDFFIAE